MQKEKSASRAGLWWLAAWSITSPTGGHLSAPRSARGLSNPIAKTATMAMSVRNSPAISSHRRHLRFCLGPAAGAAVKGSSGRRVLRVAGSEVSRNLVVRGAPETLQVRGDLHRPVVRAEQVEQHRHAPAGQPRSLGPAEELLQPGREARSRLARSGPRGRWESEDGALGQLRLWTAFSGSADGGACRPAGPARRRCALRRSRRAARQRLARQARASPVGTACFTKP